MSEPVRDKMTSETQIKISVIMVDGSFRESFHSIDFFCSQTLETDMFEVIWVEYYDSVHPELQTKVDSYRNAKIIKLNRSGVYHSSYCFNAGIQAATGKVLVIPDADVIVESHFLESVWKEHQTNEKLVMYVRRYNEAQEDHISPISIDHLKKVTRITNSTGNFGGCLTVRKNWLIKINGYEQHIAFSTGLHANGFDINMRLRNLGLHIMWHPTLKLYHAWHPYTTQPRISYERQQLIIYYRGFNMVTDAYDGIDPYKNLPLPDDLQKQLDNFDRELSYKNPSRAIKVLRFLKSRLSRLVFSR